MGTKSEIDLVEDADVSLEVEARRGYSLEEEARVLRKLDYNLLPLIFVLYSLSILDRSNLGNAKIAGLSDDIDLSGNRYNWLATIFYIGYIVFQFSNTGWKLFKPHQWIACAVFLWGTVSTLQSTTTSWGGMMVCRFLLGAAETMFGPGVPVYFSYFYPRRCLGARVGIFISASALANAYGGALAYALSHIHSHVSNWRFLFIVEGVPTCLLAIVAYFFCPDSPGTARFFTAREKEVAVLLAHSQPGDYQHEGLQLRQLFAAFKDYRSYFIAAINFGCNVSFGSLPLFLPTIISQMGTFTPLQANGMTAPPYLLCFLIILAVTALSDRLQLRGPFVAAGGAAGAAGFLVLACATGTAPRYFGIFLAVNIFVAVGVIFSWVANNAATDSKRVGGMWIMQTVGQCGPLLGTNIFPANEAPYYRKGMWVCCSFCLLVSVLSSTLSILLWRENRRRDTMDCAVKPEEAIDLGETLEADNRFRYVL